MNKAVCIAFLWVLLSCSKSNVIKEDFGCINKVVVRQTDHLISSQDLATAVNLFQSNSINYNNLRFTRYLKDTITLNNVTNTYINVRALQYSNSLPVFTSDIIFSFKNHYLDFLGGKIISTINLDNKASLKLSEVRKLFVDELSKDKLYAGFKDSCIAAEFGYDNLNAGTGIETENFVKAWKVTPQAEDYPVAFFKDNGVLIYYFNGIEYFRP